jgi:hypothetical protein
MNYVQLYDAIQNYSENTESSFVNNISRFVIEAETRIYNTVQLPALRRNTAGNLTVNNKYLSLPSDWLSTYSLAVIDSDGSYKYLLNKDVSFIRQAYPNPAPINNGLPQYYAVFGPQAATPTALSCILGPTPDASYGMELHYFYYPTSIIQGAFSGGAITSAGSLYTNGSYYDVPLTGGSGSGITANITVSGQLVTSVTVKNPGNFYVVGDLLSCSNTYIGGSGSGFSYYVNTIDNSDGTSWLGQNYDPVLFYGAMREAMLFMKGEADLVKYYEDRYQESLAELKRLGDGLQRGDAYRDVQTKLLVKS